MRILIIVLLASFFQIGFAQQYDPLKIAKKTRPFTPRHWNMPIRIFTRMHWD